MKKKFTLILAILLILSALTLTGCKTGRLRMQSALSTILPNSSTSFQLSDTHGGFHGDGETIAKVVFSKEDGEGLQKVLDGSPYWKDLPLDPLVNALIFGGEYDGDTLSGLYDSFNNEEKIELRNDAVNGYYFFRDRHSESGCPGCIDAPLYKRSSYNLTFALYDADTYTLYFFMLDT